MPGCLESSEGDSPAFLIAFRGEGGMILFTVFCRIVVSFCLPYLGPGSVSHIVGDTVLKGSKTDSDITSYKSDHMQSWLRNIENHVLI